RPVRYHYVWSDSADSGFSLLAGFVARAGFATDTLAHAPDSASLARAAVYLIVDPDTPRESPDPHTIAPGDAAAIAAWVRSGGVLLLMGNDRGNAEFVRLNALAGTFGITFNEDSRNRVTGKDYRAGTFDRFPDHPLFEGVGRIFMKEICTLSVREPAAALFTEGGDVIMAFARYGRGAVFAVGDPWFYNEYMDGRRLPAGYDNPRAAVNLFTWLAGGHRTFVEPSFPGRSLSVTSYGAVGDGLVMNTEAFAGAIHACAAAGGGTVEVPRGLWLTGPIRMESNIRLHLRTGAVILFSRNVEDYPLIAGPDGTSRVYRCTACISGYRLENIAVTGEGMLNGQGEYWRHVRREKVSPLFWRKLAASGGAVSADSETWFPSRGAMGGEALAKRLSRTKGATAADFMAAREFLRPVMLQFTDCRNVLIDGPAFVNSPSFHIQPVQCEGVMIRNVTVTAEAFAQNADGIDISSCRGVTVRNCTVDAGDDAICLKPGKPSIRQGPGPACQDILVSNCTVYHGHGGFVIGSETYGGVRGVVVRDCVFHGTDAGLRFKSAAGRGGLVEDVTVDGITMTSIGGEAILFDMLYAMGPGTASAGVPAAGEGDTRMPEFRDVVLRHVTCRGAQVAVRMTGIPGRPLGGITLGEVSISAVAGLRASDVRGIALDTVSIRTASGPAMSFTRAEHVTITGSPAPDGKAEFLRTEECAPGGVIVR
ncbi:MAG TPA: glycoside hydrolase family 28 protein, partial [Bacteroidota bacterium]|nr:glycoside hydrolase family 28 protein [Bacteroidota bacterium]